MDLVAELRKLATEIKRREAEQELRRDTYNAIVKRQALLKASRLIQKAIEALSAAGW